MPRFNAAMTRPHASGYSLMEVAMVLAIIALLVAAIMLYFQDASEANKNNELVEEIELVIATSHQIFGDSQYADVTSEALAQTKEFPAKWVNGNGLVDPWGHPIVVTPMTGVSDGGLNPNRVYLGITLTNIRPVECVKIASENVAAVEAAKINYVWTAASTLNPQTGQQACGFLGDVGNIELATD